jgi:ribosomal protein S18 acetylase RimI-like enzyme
MSGEEPEGASMEIRTATLTDDTLLVRHYLAVWESYGTPREHLLPDAEARIFEFIRDGRTHRCLGAFIAIVDEVAVGSSGCQLHLSPFPEVIAPSHRRFGYLWSVYVEPDWRRRGIALKLTECALEHLRAIGCTMAVLHSSGAGEGVYARLGFAPAKEMRLAL